MYSKYSPKGLLSPEEIYRVLKQKGMNLVTLTDQNTFSGCLDFLHKYPYRKDFVPGEEIWAYDPQFHMHVRFSVYGLNETQHTEIHRLKENVEECIQYIQNEKLVYVLLHPFEDRKNPYGLAPFISSLLKLFSVFEVHHGKIFEEHNTMLAYFIKGLTEKGICGGSHARTPKFMGSTFTVSQGHTLETFFQDLKTGKTYTQGAHGTPKRFRHEFQKNTKNLFQLLFSQTRFWFYKKQQRKLTPIWSEILGESQLNPCELPEKLIEL